MKVSLGCAQIYKVHESLLTSSSGLTARYLSPLSNKEYKMDKHCKQKEKCKVYSLKPNKQSNVHTLSLLFTVFLLKREHFPAFNFRQFQCRQTLVAR